MNTQWPSKNDFRAWDKLLYSGKNWYAVHFDRDGINERMGIKANSLEDAKAKFSAFLNIVHSSSSTRVNNVEFMHADTTKNENIIYNTDRSIWLNALSDGEFPPRKKYKNKKI